MTGLGEKDGHSSGVSALPQVAKKDFGFLPVPRYLRHDPAEPFELSTAYCWFLGVGAMVTVCV
jgi:hypothetical protein